MGRFTLAVSLHSRGMLPVDTFAISHILDRPIVDDGITSGRPASFLPHKYVYKNAVVAPGVARARGEVLASIVGKRQLYMEQHPSEITGIRSNVGLIAEDVSLLREEGRPGLRFCCTGACQVGEVCHHSLLWSCN
jgi:hypothetical protein